MVSNSLKDELHSALAQKIVLSQRLRTTTAKLESLKDRLPADAAGAAAGDPGLCLDAHYIIGVSLSVLLMQRVCTIFAS